MSRLVSIDEVTLIAKKVAERYPISLNMLAGNDAAAQELIDKTTVVETSHSTIDTDDSSDENLVEFNSESILAIHNVMLGIYGGQVGTRDVNLFESVSISPFANVFGVELYPSVFLKAAKYMFDFAHYQVFVDGNKRTGLSTAASFLEANGYEFVMPDTKAYELIFDIATNKYLEPNEFVDIIKANVVKK